MIQMSTNKQPIGQPHVDATSLTLIGMPGSGKSTLGIRLAEKLSLQFVDTDKIIEVSEGKPLQSVVDGLGYKAFRALEEQTLLGLELADSVIATGGSVVYSERAMQKLCSQSAVLFLNVDLATLNQRLHNFDSRGIAGPGDQSLAELFAEREPLYLRYAHLIVDTLGCIETLVDCMATATQNFLYISRNSRPQPLR